MKSERDMDIHAVEKLKKANREIADGKIRLLSEKEVAKKYGF